MEYITSEGKHTQISDEEMKKLRSRFKGEVLQKDDTGYEIARKVWNGMIDKQPSVILRCKNEEDIIEAVNFARENHIKVSIRGGGHNVAGNAIIENGAVIDLSEMNQVEVDEENLEAKVEAGATLGDIDKETQKFGLATPLGLVSETGVAGLSLRGGIGHLMRQFGLSSDNILSLKIVTYDGKLRNVDESNNPELYWALRGGSIDIGVITSFTFRLYPIGPEVLFYFQLFPVEKGKDGLRFLRNFIQVAPKELSMLFFYATIPDDEEFPENVRGEEVFAFYGIYTGEKKRWDEIIKSLRDFDEPLVDFGGATSYVEVQQALDVDYPGGIRYYWKSLYLDDLTDEAIERIHHWGTHRPSDLTTLDVWFMGGRIQEIDSAETAFNRRDANYMLGIESNWIEQDRDDENIKWARDTWNDISRFSEGGLYMNFAGFEEDKDELLKQSYRENYEKMMRIKEKYDPKNIF